MYDAEQFGPHTNIPILQIRRLRNPASPAKYCRPHMYDRALTVEQARLAEATPLFERSLAMFEKGLGPNHPHVAASVNNLASLLMRQV